MSVCKLFAPSPPTTPDPGQVEVVPVPLFEYSVPTVLLLELAMFFFGTYHFFFWLFSNKWYTMIIKLNKINISTQKIAVLMDFLFLLKPVF